MATAEAPAMIDAWERVTARLPLTEDLRLPGMLHGAILRSPYPHARLRHIDPRPALAIPGVVAVVTRDDILSDPTLERTYGPQIADEPIVALERVRYVGDRVAAVAAEDEATARAAVQAILVEYEPLPAVFDAVAAARPEAPLVHPDLAAYPGVSLNFDLRPVPGTNICHHFRIRRGDLAAGLAAADLVLEETFFTPSAQHVTMEPHVTVAWWEGDRLVVYTASQTPFDVQRALARLFRLGLEQVRVVVHPLGGGYGAKTFPRLEPLAALLARKAGRPVRLALSREEEFVTLNRHPATITIRLGVRRDGTITAKQVLAYWNTGAYADSGPGVATKGGYHAVGPYRIPHVWVDSYCVYTHLPPNGAFRGYSATQAVWASERMMDLAAERLGLDPLEFRQRNLLRDGDAFATGEVVHDVHFADLLQAAAQAIDWPHDQRTVLPDGTIRAKGLAVTLKGMQTPSRCEARVGLTAEGRLRVYAGTVEMGQGSRTALARLAAAVLDQPLDQVEVVFPDTAVVPFDTRTTSSRSTYMLGTAVQRAATILRQRLLDLAAELLEADPRDLVCRSGRIFVAGVPERALRLGEVVARTGRFELTAQAAFANEGGLDPDTGQGVASSHWHQSAVGAVVRVDPETGRVEVEHVHAAVYAGRVVNPVLARLQTEGNVVFGLGTALFEEIVFGEGQVLNANLSDYLIPSFADIPPRVTVTLLERPGAEVHGLGETALPPTPAAIGNAVARALGVNLTRLPLTPERLRAALAEPERREEG